jgi:ABC-type amino acid transport system permease subunit
MGRLTPPHLPHQNITGAIMQKLWRNRQLRNLSLQAMALAGLAAILGFAGFNAVTNLQNSGVTSRTRWL